MQRIILELKWIPDLELAKYASLDKSGVEGVLEKQDIFLKQWNKICLIYNVNMHLIYTYSKREQIKMHCYVVISGRAEVLKDVAKLLTYSPIGEYYCFEEIEEIAEASYVAASILVKKERTVPVEVDRNQYSNIGTVPMWKMNEGARLFDMLQMLKAVGEMGNDESSFAYRVDLFPGEYSERMRNAFSPYIQLLRKCAGELDENIVSLTEKKNSKRDDNARGIIQLYEKFLETVDVSPQFEAHIISLADSQAHADILLGAAGAESVEEGYYDLLPLGTDADGKFGIFSRADNVTSIYSRIKERDKYASLYLKWNVIFSCNEISPFFRLPALYEGEMLDIPKETAPLLEDVLQKINLGTVNNILEVSVPLKNLVKHTMICGVPGSGKTNTMLQIATQLWRDHRVPFLVFEPAKKEYRALLNDPDMKDVLLFSPKIGSKFPILINPFQFPIGLPLSEHISTIMSVFQGSFALLGPTYYFLDMSIQKAYENKGWYLEKENDGTLSYPSVSEVYEILEEEIEKSDYDGEVKGNVKAFLQVRLGGLMKRDAGAIFNTEYSTLNPEDWFKYPIVVELEALDNQDTNFFVLLMCSIIMELLRVNPNAEIEKDVRHVIFIEEAHNLIAQTTQQSSSESVDPKISATAFVVKMLAEVRALREGIIITDQLPSALAPEVMKNTSLKIVHRLTAQDDRSMIGGTMAASSVQLEELPVYNVGEAMVFYEKLRKPFKLQMIKWKEDDNLYIPLEQKELFKRLIEQEIYKDVYEKTIMVQIDNIGMKEFTLLQNEYWETVQDLQNARVNYALVKAKGGREEAAVMVFQEKVEEFEKFKKKNYILMQKLLLFCETEYYHDSTKQIIGFMKDELERMSLYQVPILQ